MVQVEHQSSLSGGETAVVTFSLLSSCQNMIQGTFQYSPHESCVVVALMSHDYTTESLTR